MNARRAAALLSESDLESGVILKNVFASAPVRDLAVARAWYARLLDRRADSVPMPEVVEWQFKGGGWLQVHAGPERAGGGSFTLSVDDMDRTLAELDALGRDTGARQDARRTRTVMIKDPDGNSIAFAWTSDPTMAS